MNKFKPGQIVQIVQNYPDPDDSYSSDEYYWGDTTNELPIGTTGTIICVGRRSIDVQFPDDEIWEFHPKELKIIQRTQKLQKLKKQILKQTK